MTRTWKCLLGAVAVCALFNHAAFAQVIESDDVGVVRVQPTDPNPVQSANSLYGEQEQIWLDDFQPPPGYGVDPVTVPRNNDVGYAVTSNVEDILYRIDRVNRHYHGLDGGWTGINAFVPMRTFNGGTSLLALDSRAFVSDYGQGGMNLGLVGRRYISKMNSVLGVSAWYDYDQAHHVDYSQLGLHASLVGPYWSVRGNVQVPVGQSHDVYGKQITPSFSQDQLLLQVNSLLETAYSQADVEFAFPMPYFARYGMEFGLGYYYLNGAIHGVEDGHGLSTRYEAQLTEDMWLNAFLTHDGVFGSNLSVNLQITLPNGPPSRFMRRLPPRQYLVASDKRPYRVLADVTRREAKKAAINPLTGLPIQVAHIDPNPGISPLAGPGGTFENPFPSIAAFEALPNSVQEDYEVILVRGRNDLSDANLNTTITLFDGQSLIGTGSPQVVNTTLGLALVPNLPFSMPTISNSGTPGVDVVRLADMNTVAGLIIDATGTANAINGQATVAENPFEAGDPGVRGFDIRDNIIRNAIVGVDINIEQSVTGEDIVGNFTNNIVELTSDDGLRVTYDGVGAPSDTLDLTIRNNLFQGTLGQAVDVDLSGSAVATFDISDNELFLVQQNTFVTGLNFVGQQADINDFLAPNVRNAVIAVSDEHIVELTENGYTVYDKATGAQIGTQSTLADFWTDAGTVIPVGSVMTEPRILYDPTVGRWFAVSIDTGPLFNNPFSNNIYVAVSNSSDPADGWSGFSFVGDTRLGIELCEFATVGIDNDGLYIATNNFGGLSPFGLTVSVYTIPKADLLGPNPSIANLSRHEGLTATNVGYGDTLQPVVDFGTSDGGEIIGLGDSVTTFIRSTVTGADTANSTLSSPTEFTVTPYSFPGNPTTPAGFPLNSTTVLPVSSPISSSVVKVGNSIWAVQSISPPDPLTGFASSIQWYEIDATTNTMLQSGVIEDPNIGFISPSIAVNERGQVVIGMSGTGPNLLPSTFAVAGQTDANGVTTFGAPIVTSQGQAEYSLFAWGTYSATVLDPTARNSNVFWTVQERTTDQEDFWATQITQVIAGLGGNDGIVVRAHDTSTVLTGSTIDRNNIQGGTGSGLAILADGGAFVDLSSTINDNTITGMGTNGMFFASDGGATLLIDGNRNNVSGNGGIGLFMQSFGASTLTVDLRNSQFDENGERGIQAEAHDASTLTFSLTSPFDPFAIGPSSASNNTQQGMNLKAFDDGNLIATIDDVIVDPNGDAGISVLLEDDSTGLVSITDSVIIDTIDGPDVDLFGEGIVLRTVENSSLTALVDNNLIDGHISNGMRSVADGSSTLDVTITNNRITNNNTDLLNNTGGVGLVFDRRSDSLLLGAVSGNIVTDNGSGGMIVRTTGGNNLLAGTVINADNNDFSDNGFNGGGDGVAITTAGSSVTLVNLTCNLIDNSETNGISVNANNQSFFGQPPLTPSVFDSNIVTNSGANGILLNENNQAFLFLDIVSDEFAAAFCDEPTLIANNAVDGIQLNTTGSGTTSVRVGNAANPFPDVTITQNLDDAIQIAMSGTGIVNFSVANTSLTGARVLGVAGDPGLNVTYTGTDNARIRVGQDMGADHVINDMTDDRAGVDIYNFAGDGVFVDYDPTGGAGNLNMLFADSRIGLDGTRFNTGDGVEINARGNGFRAEFYGNTIRNNLDDGVRFITLTDLFNARTIVVPGDPGPGGVFPDPPLTAQDGDASGNQIGDFPTANSPFLLGTPFYVADWGDRSPGAITSTATLIFGDPSQGARFAGNNISANGDDGIELSIGAGSLLNATVRGNTLVGNTSADFRTSTATNPNLLVPLSTNRAEGNPDDVVLDPVAHLRLDFGDSSLLAENINIGNILLPTTTGGTISSNGTDPFKPNGRAIVTDFRVVVPDEVFPPSDNNFTIFGVDQNESMIFLNNGFNAFGGTIQ